MDQKIRLRGSRITITILSFCTLFAFVLGTGYFLGYPEQVWWIGAFMMICGIFCLYATLSIYFSYKKEQRVSKIQFAEITSGQSTSMATAILASWIYSESEWHQFINWERRKRLAGTLVEMAGIVIMGTILIRFSKEGEWIHAIGFSLAFSLIYGAIKYQVMLSSIKRDAHKMPEVLITHESVLINGHMNRFYGENLWLGKVHIIETRSMNVLELVYCWNTKHGKTSDEIRVPIPKGKLREAIVVQEVLSTK